MRKRTIIKLAIAVVMVAVLIGSALRGGYAFSSFLMILLSLVPFYASFERRKPRARELVPIAVLAAVAALGRALFAPFPNVKPVSSVVIISGIAFGPEAGFMTGATAALSSNLFFGQGAFTPWQMFAWGLMGFCAGAFGRLGLAKNRVVLCVFGFAWGFLFGWIMDLYQLLSYIRPITPESILLNFAASLYFDSAHAVSNVAFLLLIGKPWLKILSRVKVKYGLVRHGQN